ncbi:MAG: T9SS type A sorting domain-containing protein [Bacteroidetes bacterium]|nr:T9SS type A sorting domain-containing protein [Bacteroidota bacterium]
MKIIIVVVFTLVFMESSYSQTIINGDFENNSASSCEFNLQNSVYSNRMNNSWGFGSNDELDIQTNTCGLVNPPSNDWFVSLSKNPNGTYDELSLELSANLILGNTYEISYFEFAANIFNNSNIPLQLGLSTDSLNFGQVIYNSLPIINTWTQRTFSFIAPNNGKYITVRIDSAGFLKAYNLIDNIQLTTVNGINDNSLHTAACLFPNPTNGKFTISFPSSVQYIQILNSLGQVIKMENVNGLTSLNFEIETNGVYFVNFSTKKDFIAKKLIVY